MSVEVARKVVESLDSKILEENLGKPFFGDPRYTSFSLIKDGFRLIEDREARRKIAFVDGGNQEVLGAPNFSVQINRVYCGIFAGQDRIFLKSLPNRVEFFPTLILCLGTMKFSMIPPCFHWKRNSLDYCRKSARAISFGYHSIHFVTALIRLLIS